jgi:hypothetical protein
MTLLKLRRHPLLTVLSIAIAVITGAVWAASPPPRSGPPGLDRTIDQLGLTDDQKSIVDPIVKDYRDKEQLAREQFLGQMKAALTPEQYAKLESSMNRGGPPPPPPRRQQGRNSSPAVPTTLPASVKLPDGSLQMPVIFTGGYETDSRDHGRPVVLIAAALGVPGDVFREAFTHVTPAGPGEQPQDAQVRRNKAALMKALGPYGITDERLNSVSNYYRYSGSRGQMWRNHPATATAHVVNGIVKEFTITDAGAGYSSPPEISIPGMDNVKAEATLSFGTDFKTNGSIKAITMR